MLTESAPVRLSVLVPAFNPGHWGPRAISSVLPQLSVNDEIIIQDGGSSQEWLLQLPQDRRIRIVSQPDDGQADALNHALARARGKWVMWLNADDIVFADTLNQIDFDSESSPMLTGAFATIDADENNIRTFRPANTTLDGLIFKGCTLYSGSTIFQTEFLREIGGFNKDFHFCMDYDLFLRALASKETLKVLPIKIGALRIHPGTKTTSTPWKFVAEARRARLPHITTIRRKVAHVVQTAYHSLLISTTTMRASRIYLVIRGRAR